MSSPAESLKMLHDRLRFVLEDPTGRFFHEPEFEREFEAAIAEAEAEPVTIDRETLGERLALVDDHDGCHARVREWEALEQWEKDAHPDEEPFTDREDAEWWNRRADAVIANLAAQPVTGMVEYMLRVPGEIPSGAIRATSDEVLADKAYVEARWGKREAVQRTAGEWVEVN